jgi:hypothetical protein
MSRCILRVALLAPLAIEWLCVGIDRVHGTSIHAG